MRKFTLIGVLAAAAWWSMLLPAWVLTAGQTVSGTEANRTLALIPGVVILLGLVSLYGKGRRTLLVAAALASAITSVLVLVSDLGNSPRVIELQERATGIAGGNEDFEVLWPVYAFAILGLLVAGVLIMASVKRQIIKPAVDSQPTDEADPRFIWDQQGK